MEMKPGGKVYIIDPKTGEEHELSNEVKQLIIYGSQEPLSVFESPMAAVEIPFEVQKTKNRTATKKKYRYKKRNKKRNKK